MIDTTEILTELENIPDPEIPVLNIVEMGIVREVVLEGKEIIVKITPTYSGCPAMKAIEDDITFYLKKKGFDKVTIKKVYSPAWTTDFLSDETKQKLKDYGIAPPEGRSDDEFYHDLITKPVQCPYCNSTNTKLTSEFGSTACKSLHYCNDCIQPFEHFKCV